MRKKKLLDALNLADEKYITEADPAVHRKNVLWRNLGIIAACVCFVVAASNLWLFWPLNGGSNLSAYKNSEYYSVIEKIDDYYAARAPYKNRFEKYIDNFFLAKGEDMSNGAGDRAPAAENYQEVTDNQVNGIVEGDLIKRSDRHIYYLRKGRLDVYSIAGEDSKQVGSFSLASSEVFAGKSLYTYAAEMYLSADCTTVTVLMPHYDSSAGTAMVSLILLDVTDPQKITVKNDITVSGGYISSRKTEDGFLLFTNFAVQRGCDYDTPASFLPQITYGGETQSVRAQDIVAPETLNSASYTVALLLDEETLAARASTAFLSYSDEVYVSEDNIFATRTYTAETEQDRIVTRASYTEISMLSYTAEGFALRGTFSVEGYIKDRYSLDEHEGILRIVTTTSVAKRESREDGWSRGELADAAVSSSTVNGTGQNANLYCIRLSDLSIAAEVIAFAPAGEMVRSVRFDGTNAYVCTSIVLQDPVFFFDLSDLSNITFKDTGTIDGYSSSLVDFGEGYLLGIGYGSSFSDVKIEIYKESESGVVYVDSYTVSGASFSEDYKSYYIDRQNRMVGLGVTRYYSDPYGYSSFYLLLRFDGYGLQEVIREPLDGADQSKRGVLIGDYFYMFSEQSFEVRKIS